MEKIDKYEGYSEYDKWQARKKTTLRLIYKYKRTTNYKYKEDLDDPFGMDRTISYNFKTKISNWRVNGCTHCYFNKLKDYKTVKQSKEEGKKRMGV